MKKDEFLVLWDKIGKVIADEMSVNPDFAKKMESAVQNNTTTRKMKSKRNPAKIDPLTVLEDGEDRLLEELKKLSLEELKDVISANGMDTSKLAMKWKDRKRLEDLIIESTKRKALRGNAFWNSGDSD